MLTRPSSTLHVTVKLIQGLAINLEMQSWYTIAEVTLIIGFPQDCGFKLFCSVQDLKDEKTLQYYEIKDNAALEFKPAWMQIFVTTFDGKSIVMMLDEYEKVSDVAVRIGKKLNLDPQHFGVLHMGRRLISERTLVKNSIGNDSVLRLRKSHVSQ